MLVYHFLGDRQPCSPGTRLKPSQTGAAHSWKRHPGWRIGQAALRMSLNTDDPSICGTTLTEECRRAEKAGWNRAQGGLPFVEAAMAAFVSPSEELKLRRRMLESWTLTK